MGQLQPAAERRADHRQGVQPGAGIEAEGVVHPGPAGTAVAQLHVQLGQAAGVQGQGAEHVHRDPLHGAERRDHRKGQGVPGPLAVGLAHRPAQAPLDGVGQGQVQAPRQAVDRVGQRHPGVPLEALAHAAEQALARAARGLQRQCFGVGRYRVVQQRLPAQQARWQAQEGAVEVLGAGRAVGGQQGLQLVVQGGAGGRHHPGQAGPQPRHPQPQLQLHRFRPAGLGLAHQRRDDAGVVRTEVVGEREGIGRAHSHGLPLAGRLHQVARHAAQHQAGLGLRHRRGLQRMAGQRRLKRQGVEAGVVQRQKGLQQPAVLRRAIVRRAAQQREARQAVGVQRQCHAVRQDIQPVRVPVVGEHVREVGQRPGEHHGHPCGNVTCRWPTPASPSCTRSPPCASTATSR